MRKLPETTKESFRRIRGNSPDVTFYIGQEKYLFLLARLEYLEGKWVEYL